MLSLLSSFFGGGSTGGPPPAAARDGRSLSLRARVAPAAAGEAASLGIPPAARCDGDSHVGEYDE